ncbi:MAG: hypothetical protein ACO20W_08580, partial [Anaerohalosphaeraceae bacterium]
MFFIISLLRKNRCNSLPKNKTTTVTVFGTSKAQPEEAVFQMAETLGRLLAKNGFTIANGGYGGTMLAGAKGAA